MYCMLAALIEKDVKLTHLEVEPRICATMNLWFTNCTNVIRLMTFTDVWSNPAHVKVTFFDVSETI